MRGCQRIVTLIFLLQVFSLLHPSSAFQSPTFAAPKGFFRSQNSLSYEKRAPTTSFLRLSRTNFLSNLRLQKDPRQNDRFDEENDFFSSIADSLAAAKRSFANGIADNYKESDVAKLLVAPLLALPLWFGVVFMGLHTPSPEMIIQGFSNTAQTMSSVPWDSSAPAIAKEVAQAAASASNPFGSSQGGINLKDLANPQLDPNLFVPVCKFSDTFYRGAKNSVLGLAGPEVYQEYAPLIAGSLLRVRLEFCVLESFVYESIIPFIKARGLSWVFPLRETLETFVAGVVFAVASNVVLIGSTKIISIAIFYTDFFLGLPIRLTFGFINDQLVKRGAGSNPVGLALIAGTGAVRLVGQTTELARKFIEFWDVFVGRYLLLTTFGYVVLKFLKFKGVLTIEKLGALWNALISTSDFIPQ